MCRCRVSLPTDGRPALEKAEEQDGNGYTNHAQALQPWSTEVPAHPAVPDVMGCLSLSVGEVDGREPQSVRAERKYHFLLPWVRIRWERGLT